MGHSSSRERFRKADTIDHEHESWGQSSRDERDSSDSAEPRGRGSNGGYVSYDPGPDRQALGERYGIDVGEGQARKLQRLEGEFGSERVSRWADEGMTVGTMGKPRDMQAFRKRQEERPEEVPTDIERRNEASLQRNAAQNREDGPPGDTGVPDVLRSVISSPGRSMDETVQREMESNIGGDFSDVQLHTGPKAAAAADSINARAFTVGNHVAFNRGEYEPESSEGQHVLAHELTHVRQQTEGAVSMQPKAEANLAIDPDAGLEREAEETAREVTAEPRTVRRLGTEIHVQPKLEVSSPSDPAECEAERVAEQVMEASDERQEQPVTDERGETASANRGASPTERERDASGDGRTTSTSRPAATPTQDRTPRIDESPGSGGAGGDQQTGEGVERALQSTSGGQPFPPAARSFFEPRFGRDFGNVRVHTGGEAADLNRTLNAKAFTHGSDIYFGEGQYRPESTDGKKLMAHELTHVVQQSGDGGAVSRTGTTTIQRNCPDDYEGIDVNSQSLKCLFEMWVKRDYQNKSPDNPSKEKVQKEVQTRLNKKSEDDLVRFLRGNQYVQYVKHANAYWLREAIKTRLFRTMDHEKPGALELEGGEVQDPAGLFEMWVRYDYQHDNQPDHAPNEAKIKPVIRRKMNEVLQSEPNKLQEYLDDNHFVNHANGYWLREEIRNRVPKQCSDSSEIIGKPGVNVNSGDQVFIRCVDPTDSDKYLVKFKNSPDPVSASVPKNNVEPWTAAVDPESSLSEIKEDLEDETDGSASGKEESKDGSTERAAKRRKMIQLAHEQWSKGIADTDHRTDIGRIHVIEELNSKIDTKNVKLTSKSTYKKGNLEDTIKVVVTNVDKSMNKGDRGELREDIANLLNIFVATGPGQVSPKGNENVDKYVGGEKEAWCGRFVGSLAAEVDVRTDVIERAMVSTYKLLEAGETGVYGSEGYAATSPAKEKKELKGKGIYGMQKRLHELPTITQVDSLKPGDIVTVETSSNGKSYGDHIVLAADSPIDGYLPTVEGNGSGWQPDGTWVQGIVKRFRATDKIKKKYRLTKEHFE